MLEEQVIWAGFASVRSNGVFGGVVAQRGLSIRDAGLRSRRSARRVRLARTLSVAAIVAVLAAGAAFAACSRHATPGTAVKPTAKAAVATQTVAAKPRSSIQTTPPAALLKQPDFDRTRFTAAPIQSVKTAHREVAITFDDGPSPATPAFLKVLAKDKAHATFFLVGFRAWRYPKSVYEIVAQGNEVGSHTWSHVELKKLGARELRTQIDRAQTMLTSETGQAPLFIRPRSGKYDALGLAATRRRGLVVVLWSAHANDIGNILPPKELVNNALDGVHPGSIILMHETNSNTLKALPSLLAELKHRGLKPVTLSRLLADAEK